MYEEALKNLRQIGADIQDEFFEYSSVDVELLKSITLLLNSIDEKGLKLTPKGFLPTKLVKAIVDVGATTADKQYIALQKRFFEEENISANMSHIIVETLKFVQLKKGKLFLTKKGTKFLSLNKHQQYIIILNIMFGLNIGYFDGHQEAMCVHNSSVVMLQLLRDKSTDFRTVEVYSSLLLDMYPSIEDNIEDLELSDYSNNNQFDVYSSIMELRLFERFFLPLGLVEMEIAKYPKANKFAKTKLLDILLKPKYAINKELVFSKKLSKEFDNEIKDKKLTVDLFETIMYLFAQYSHVPVVSKESAIDQLMQKHSVIGTLRDDYESFYSKLIDSVLTTFEEFVQFDAVGHSASKDKLVKEYQEMIDAFYLLLNTPKPFNTVQKLHVLPAFIFDILKLHYNLDSFSEDFVMQCSEVFDEEFSMNVGGMIVLYNQLHKDAKKLKKNKPNFSQGLKEFIQVYMMIVFEIRSRCL